MTNLFNLPSPLPSEEVFETLVPDHGIRIERILSTGQTTPKGTWYDQDRDEWVALLQGEATIVFEGGLPTVMRAGDCLLIPAHRRHRVTYTASDPPCIWLAIHAHLGV